MVYTPSQWAHIWLELVENWKKFPTNSVRCSPGNMGAGRLAPRQHHRVACPQPGKTIQSPSGIVHVWNFRKQGPWDKGSVKPPSPGSSPPATHCRAGPGERKIPRDIFLGRSRAICHALHLGPWAIAHRPRGWWWGSAPHWPPSGPPWRRHCLPWLHSLINFFISLSICTKFGMHVTLHHRRPPTDFETNPTTLIFFSLAGSWAQWPAAKPPSARPAEKA